MELPKVLLVEDEALVAMVAAEFLGELGYEVVEAATARAAVQHLHADSTGFAFALIDLGLPDRPGEELAEEMKKLRPTLPLIIASGYGEPHARARFKACDELVFLQKPYEKSGLQFAIEALGIA